MLTQTSTIVDAVSFFLREPRKLAQHLLESNIAFLKAVESRRNELQTDAQLASILENFSFPQLEDFAALQQIDPRSRIVASYHFGQFPYALNYLMSLECCGCNRHFLSQEASSHNYFKNMGNLFGRRAVERTAQHILDKNSTLELSSLLRGDSCNLVMFCDLPENYGSRIAVPFLGRQAWFPQGPAALAVFNNVPVLPVITTSRGNSNQLHLGKQLEPSSFPGEQPTAAIDRISTQLANYFQTFFQEQPEQWRYLQFLPSYFLENRLPTH